MKYKAGDVVRIKTWEEMEDQHRTSPKFDSLIQHSKFEHHFKYCMEQKIQKNYLNRILTIKETIIRPAKSYNFYTIKEILMFAWQDWMIEELVESGSIDNRFEILDI